MKRYYVSRHYIKWKGKLYRKGELLPPQFTHHDKARNIYSSRIGVIDLEDEAPKESSFAATGSEKNTPSQIPAAPKIPGAISGAVNASIKGTSPAGAPKISFTPKTTGAPK
jgi:hypothetical protein